MLFIIIIIIIIAFFLSPCNKCSQTPLQQVSNSLFTTRPLIGHCKLWTNQLRSSVNQ